MFAIGLNMKLYDSKGLPNPDRIRIALAEKGILDQVEFIQIDLRKGEQRTPEFRAKNVNASVPLLELEDGTAISECTAITEYIDHAFEGICLTRKMPKERAIVHMMQRRGEQKIVDAIGAYFHHATVGFGPLIELDQNKAWGEKHKQVTIDGMHYFNDVLAKQPYVAGNNFSMADITVFTGLNFSEEYPKVYIPDNCTHLLAWREKIAKRPSTQF